MVRIVKSLDGLERWIVNALKIERKWKSQILTITDNLVAPTIIDVLDVIELAMDAEEEFGIEIDDSIWEDQTTVEGFAQLIRREVITNIVSANQQKHYFEITPADLLEIYETDPQFIHKLINEYEMVGAFIKGHNPNIDKHHNLRWKL